MDDDDDASLPESNKEAVWNPLCWSLTNTDAAVTRAALLVVVVVVFRKLMLICESTHDDAFLLDNDDISNM